MEVELLGTLEFTAEGGGMLNVPRNRYDSLSSLVHDLKEDDDNSTYYRGQSSRYIAQYEGEIKKLKEAQICDELHVQFESLVPRRFREDFDTLQRPDWDSYQYPTFLDQISTGVRAVMKCQYSPLRNLLKSYLVEIAENPTYAVHRVGQEEGFFQVDIPEDLTIGRTNVQDSLLKLISISQHYEFGSAMTDITNSVDIAAWFASHSWKNGDLIQDNNSGHGVVYKFKKFDTNRINQTIYEEIRDESPEGHRITATRLLGKIDISDMGKEFGKRPQAQQGGSILGLENTIVYMLLTMEDVLEVNTFPLSSVTGNETSKTLSDIAPPNDPLLNVFDSDESYPSGPIRNEEYDNFLRNEGVYSELRERILRYNEAGIL